MQLHDFMQQVQERVNNTLKDKLASMAHVPSNLKEAMEYGLLLGGKRARPFLVYATGQSFGASLKDLDYVAAAVECIHAYSLIHDDMPEMDNDLLRRGQSAVHVKFGQTLALLAGDTLQALAFEMLSDEKNRLSFDVKGRMTLELAKASGFSGMCGGQALDLEAESKTLSLSELEHLHSLKTGALICASVRLGYMAARYQEFYNNQHQDAFASALGFVEGPQLTRELNALSTYGAKVGLAFQVWDDVLDVEGDTQVLGKEVGSDERRQKSTYVSLLGLEKAKEYAKSLVDEAIDSLESLDANTKLLKEFATFCITRDH